MLNLHSHCLQQKYMKFMLWKEIFLVQSQSLMRPCTDRSETCWSLLTLPPLRRSGRAADTCTSPFLLLSLWQSHPRCKVHLKWAAHHRQMCVIQTKTFVWNKKETNSWEQPVQLGKTGNLPAWTLRQARWFWRGSRLWRRGTPLCSQRRRCTPPAAPRQTLPEARLSSLLSGCGAPRLRPLLSSRKTTAPPLLTPTPAWAADWRLIQSPRKSGLTGVKTERDGCQYRTKHRKWTARLPRRVPPPRGAEITTPPPGGHTRHGNIGLQPHVKKQYNLWSTILHRYFPLFHNNTSGGGFQRFTI